MQTVDVRGQKCPVPIIETKRALKDVNNLSRFLKDNKIKFSSTESDGVWSLTIIKPG